MMTVFDYYQGTLFFSLLVLLLIISVIRGAAEKPAGGFALLSSVLTAVFVFAGKADQACWLLVSLAWYLGLILFWQYEREKRGRAERLYHVVLVLSLVPLICCKVSGLLHASLFAFTGISYLTFRVVQILIEMYDGVITRVRVRDILTFFLFFPSFSSGPIDRSRRFEEDLTKRRTREEALSLTADGFVQLLSGMIYKFILAGVFFKAMAFLDTPDAVWYHRIGYAYAYGLYLFFDFAGYSRMAVGTAYVMGIELPGNFRAPFLAVDMRDFWDRWHITLSHWFRDFVFTRFVMYSTRRKWFRDRLTRACVGFMVNMGIMGLWHGLTPAYILYGLYHGVLLAVTEVYQKKSSFYKKNKNRKCYRLVSWFVTMQMVFFGFYIFSGQLI